MIIEKIKSLIIYVLSVVMAFMCGLFVFICFIASAWLSIGKEKETKNEDRKYAGYGSYRREGF